MTGLSWLAIAIISGCQRTPPEPVVLDPNLPTQEIEHAMGTTTVPLAPERVVVIDSTPLDAAIALGIKPVGTILYGEHPAYLGEAVKDIEIVGEYNQPNLETILGLEPDLILGAKSVSEKIYPELASIAPTVFIQGAGYSWDWQNNFRIFAKALDQSDKAEELLTAYQQQLEELQAKIAVPPEDLEISVVVSTPQGLVAHTPTSFSGSILKEIGFSRTPAQATDEQFFVRLSREDLEGSDGDLLFLIHNSTWMTKSKEKFTGDRLWSQLDAVKNNAVCEVDGAVWGSGRSILAAHEILRDVEACLTTKGTD